MRIRIIFEERFKYLSICTKKKEILITYWGGLKFIIQRKINDSIKDNFCLGQNISLVRINYKDEIISELNRFLF